ncbi:hypothetical protein [Natrinema pallidum]|uniref:hypothetical protein n=1 Tax=Natrinema pallidum TaxID=69527 RepID=UPI0037527027
MRKYLYLITEHPDEDKVGQVITTDSPKPTAAEKNVEGVCQNRDLDSGETWSFIEVGLGYADFSDESDYLENGLEVIQKKLGEIDEEYLEKAGIDLEEVNEGEAA